MHAFGWPEIASLKIDVEKSTAVVLNFKAKSKWCSKLLTTINLSVFVKWNDNFLQFVYENPLLFNNLLILFHSKSLQTFFRGYWTIEANSLSRCSEVDWRIVVRHSFNSFQFHKGLRTLLLAYFFLQFSLLFNFRSHFLFIFILLHGAS